MPSLPLTILQAANSEVIIHMDTHRLLLICKPMQDTKDVLLFTTILFSIQERFCRQQCYLPFAAHLQGFAHITEKCFVVYYCSVQGKFSTASAMASLPKR